MDRRINDEKQLIARASSKAIRCRDRIRSYPGRSPSETVVSTSGERRAPHPSTSLIAWESHSGQTSVPFAGRRASLRGKVARQSLQRIRAFVSGSVPIRTRGSRQSSESLPMDGHSLSRSINPHSFRSIGAAPGRRSEETQRRKVVMESDRGYGIRLPLSKTRSRRYRAPTVLNRLISYHEENPSVEASGDRDVRLATAGSAPATRDHRDRRGGDRLANHPHLRIDRDRADRYHVELPASPRRTRTRAQSQSRDRNALYRRARRR